MTITKLSQIDSKGLVIFDGSKFTFVAQDEIPKHKISQPSPTLVELVKLQAAVAVLDEQPARVFVNYDRLNFIGTTAALHGKSAGAALSPKGREVVVHENGEFFSIPENLWEPLPDEGDAQVLVQRGAVVATIPRSPLPIGTFCVLVNLDRLMK